MEYSINHSKRTVYINAYLHDEGVIKARGIANRYGYTICFVM